MRLNVLFLDKPYAFEVDIEVNYLSIRTFEIVVEFIAIIFEDRYFSVDLCAVYCLRIVDDDLDFALCVQFYYSFTEFLEPFVTIVTVDYIEGYAVSEVGNVQNGIAKLMKPIAVFFFQPVRGIDIVGKRYAILCLSEYDFLLDGYVNDLEFFAELAVNYNERDLLVPNGALAAGLDVERQVFDRLITFNGDFSEEVFPIGVERVEADEYAAVLSRVRADQFVFFSIPKFELELSVFCGYELAVEIDHLVETYEGGRSTLHVRFRVFQVDGGFASLLLAACAEEYSECH